MAEACAFAADYALPTIGALLYSVTKTEHLRFFLREMAGTPAVVLYLTIMPSAVIQR
jgi:hypothetical protein